MVNETPAIGPRGSGAVTTYQELRIVDAETDRVFRLIADIASWGALLPCVREVDEVGPGRWRIVCVWRWIPFAVMMSARLDHAHAMAEFRVVRWPGTRVAMRWAVDAGPDETASVRLETEIVRTPWPCSPLVRLIAQDISLSMLDMFRLLAESDQKAHQNIQE